MQLLFPVFVCLLMLGLSIGRIVTYRSFRTKGTKCTGRLLGFRSPFNSGGLGMFWLSTPVLIFNTEEDEMILPALGLFKDAPCEIGDEIEIYYWEKRPDRVVIEGKRYERNFIVFNCVLSAMVLMLLGVVLFGGQ